MEKNMTALVSCFVRNYHYKNNKLRIFNDNIAGKIISEDEYNSISNYMANGIKFFNSSFIGDEKSALKWIVNNQLSPSVLGRCAFCEKMLMNAIKFGCKEYLIFASGYDTFAYRTKIRDLKIFEIDKKEMINDKISRLKNANIDFSNVEFIKCDFNKHNWFNNVLNSKYDKEKISFSSLLGISYYLTRESFYNMINIISKNVCENSSIIFDYQAYDGEKEVYINEKLAKGANEEMKSKYSYDEIESILSDNNFLIYEHLTDKDMTNDYFNLYNLFNPDNKIKAPKGVSYCLAVKKII